MNRTVLWILSCMLALCTYAQSVVVIGNKIISTDIIRQKADFPHNQDADAWNNAVKRLYATGWFDKITVDVEPDETKVIVKEYPTLLAFKVESRIEQLKPEKIIDMLHDAGFKRGQPIAKHNIEQWRLGVIRELQRMGYAGADVVLNLEPKPHGVVLDLVFISGERTLTRKIIIEGQTVFSPKEVLALIDVKQDSFFRFFDGAHKVSEEKLRSIQNKLIDFYENNGYFGVKVSVKFREVSIKKDKKMVDIIVHIDAGKQSMIDKIYPIGPCDGDLVQYMGAVEGTPYVADHLQGFLKKSGKISPILDVKIQPRLVDDRIDIMMICQKIPPLVIRDIDIVGDGTDDLLLRRLLDFDIGDEWVGGWVNTSKRRLLGQPFISDVQINLKPSMQTGETDVVIVVEESKKNTMASFRMSYETGGSGLSFGGGFSNRNFLGTGNALSLDAQYGAAMWYTDLQLVQPVIPLHASALMGFSFRVTHQEKLNMGPYKQDLASAYYGYRWLLNDNTLFQSQLTLKANHFKLFNPIYEQDLGYFAQLGYDPIEFLWTNTWVRDTRDRAEKTTSGYVMKMNVSTVIPILQDMMAYYQLNPSFTSFYRLGTLFYQPLVLRGNMQVGYGQSYGKNAGQLPFYNRYYAGGIGTVRGYNIFSLGPKYIMNNMYNQPYPQALGGDWLVVGNLDLILPSPYPDFLQPSLFIDAGNVFLGGTDIAGKFQDLGPIDLSKLRYSTGLSTAISTPFAQLTVTFARFFNTGDERFSTITVEMGRQF